MATNMREAIESGYRTRSLHASADAKELRQWKWHERLRPGVLHHVSAGGDEIWTVRAGTQRQMDTRTIRELCRIADTLPRATCVLPYAATSSSWSVKRRRSAR